MRRITAFSAFIVIGLFASCSNETTYAPADTCDDQSAGGFSISNPERGRVYVWGGMGMAGSGEMGKGPGYTKLYWPVDICFDPIGSPIVLDWNNHRVLAVDGNGKFQKIIGRYFGNPVDGPALEADLNHPTHVCFSPDGSKLYLAAWHNSIVMEMDRTTTWISRYSGTGARNFNGDELPRLQTMLDLPVSVLFHPITGELYISDQANHIIRKVDASGVVHIVAGTAPTPNGVGGWNYQFGYSGDGGPATSARLSFDRGQNANPTGRICFDPVGNMYIADTSNHAVRIVTPDGNIDTIAGKGPGTAGYSGDGGPAKDAQLNDPRDVAADADGNVFIADTGNHVIRKVDSSGVITTVVGVVRPTNSSPISACDLHDEQGAPAREVHLTLPFGIELDADGNLWIADTQNNVIRIFYR
jgi:hypothetical protein